MKAENSWSSPTPTASGTRPDDPNSLIRHLTVAQIDEMVKSGVISSGMFPKSRGVHHRPPRRRQ